jgi:hypothetical protein
VALLAEGALGSAAVYDMLDFLFTTVRDGISVAGCGGSAIGGNVRWWQRSVVATFGGGGRSVMAAIGDGSVVVEAL